MNIKPLFPTALASFPNFITSKERVELWKRIKSISHLTHPAILDDGSSTFAKPSKILDNNIKNRIQDALDEYNRNCGNIPSKLKGIWSNIQNSGSRLVPHCHANSLVSGALYINVGDNGRLNFHNPNPYVYYMYKKDSTLYNAESYKAEVKNCELILFPGWLQHGKYDDINEMDERIVVSFNSIID